MKVFEAKERQGRYLREMSPRLVKAQGSSAAAGLGSEGRRGGGHKPLTKAEIEFYPPQARVTEVGAAEGIPKVEGEFLTGDIADIQSC